MTLLTDFLSVLHEKYENNNFWTIFVAKNILILFTFLLIIHKPGEPAAYF